MKPRRLNTVEVDFLDFVETFKRLAKQALGEHAGEPASGGFVRRNADDLHTVAADNGFQDWHTEYEFYSLGVEPLIHYRGSSINAISSNALIRERGYTQRWMAETSYSSVKRSLGDAVRAQAWYREFREIGLMFAISNIEQLCDPL